MRFGNISSVSIFTLLVASDGLLTVEAREWKEPDPETLELYGNNGWGSWRGMKRATKNPGGMYACGAQVRLEGQQGGGIGHDDTAANGLKLVFCHVNDWYVQETVTIYPGNWGSWRDTVKCPANTWISGGRIRFENWLGSGGGDDDTAWNGLKIWCADFDGKNGKEVLVEDGYWGEWKSLQTIPGKFVEAAELKFEESQGTGSIGTGNDDTAGNNIRFLMNYPNDGMSQAAINGSWRKINSGAMVSQSITVTVTVGGSTTITEEQGTTITESVSAGFGFMGFNMGTEIGTEYTSSVANSVSKDISASVAVENTVSCPKDLSDTGIWVLWQWRLDQADDVYGSGFTQLSGDYRCTNAVSAVPRCPVGMCASLECQKCIEESGNVNGW